MLKQAREREKSEGFKEEYKRRAGVEGTMIVRFSVNRMSRPPAGGIEMPTA